MIAEPSQFKLFLFIYCFTNINQLKIIVLVVIHKIASNQHLCNFEDRLETIVFIYFMPFQGVILQK